MRSVILTWAALLSVATAALLTCGCTTTIKPPAQTFSGYRPQDKIDLKVGLHLTPDFCGAKWEKNATLIPIGESLCRNAETLARHAFRDVVLTPDRAAPNTPGVDAILTPKLAYINRTTGATSFGESIISVKVEWNLSDLQGRPIWVETIGGQGSGSTGWTDPAKVLKIALEDLLLKSQSALASAEAVKKVAQAKR